MIFQQMMTKKKKNFNLKKKFGKDVNEKLKRQDKECFKEG
jgi:hypothetical protein